MDLFHVIPILVSRSDAKAIGWNAMFAVKISENATTWPDTWQLIRLEHYRKHIYYKNHSLVEIPNLYILR